MGLRMRVRIAVVAAMVCCWWPGAFAQQEPLLLDAGAARAAANAPPQEAAVRSRLVTVNRGAMPSTSSTPGELLRLNLFNDASFDVVLEAVSARSADRYTWVGRLADDALSNVALVAHGEVTQINVHSPVHGEYQLRYVGDGIHEAREIDPSLFPPCATGPEMAVTPPAGASPVAPKTRGSISPVGILVVYTPSARAAAGGVAAMEALIDLAVGESNDAYSFSQINLELNLLGTFEVDYDESVGFSTALVQLRATGDGVIDEVHVAREALGADMVSMLINNPQSCGLAYVMTSLAGDFSSSAFSVEHYTCATGYFSFAHELGHNMGAAHDLDNTPGGALFPYSIGWHWGNSMNPGYDGDYRSIMAYAPGTRVQRFSNPNINYGGEPTGSSNVADNALTLNSSASTVSGWRNDAAWITVLPLDGVTSTGDEGGPFVPSALAFELTNRDSTSANWTASSSKAWAVLSSGSGSLGASASTTVTVSIGAAAGALPDGAHTATVTFSDTTNGKAFPYVVTLNVTRLPSSTTQYLETLDTNPGWATTGQWEFGVPQGNGSINPDPTSGYTGSNVYGYNLAGDYENDMALTPLTSTAFDCSNLENVWLSFWRWLGVESSSWDHAKIRVSTDGFNWTDIWNHNGGAIAETSWSNQMYDISALADGQSTVYVRWVMGTTDGSVTYSGWNIDDVAILGDAIGANADDVWVSFSHGGVEKGTSGLPYNTLPEGVSYLNSGGTLHVVSGATDYTGTFDTPMTITAESGAVVIGQSSP